ARMAGIRRRATSPRSLLPEFCLHPAHRRPHQRIAPSPMVTQPIPGTTLGMAQTASVLELGAWFFLAPLAIGAALVVPGVAPRYSRLADIFATIVVAVV